MTKTHALLFCVLPARLAKSTRRLASIGLVVALMQLGATRALDAQTAPHSEPAGYRLLANSPEAAHVYNAASEAQNAARFEAALVLWTSFLDRYPLDPLAARARFFRGVCRLKTRDLAGATSDLETVLKAGESPLFEAAMINLAWCTFTGATDHDQDQLTMAQTQLARYLARFPNGQFVDQALFYHAECLYREDQIEQAATTYRRLVDKFPQSAYRPAALYALGIACQDLRRHDEALSAFDTFLTESPHHELRVEVLMRKADSLAANRDWEDAAALFAHVAEADRYPLADYSLFRQAMCFEELSRHAEASALYRQVVDRFPTSQYAAAAGIATARTAYRAGHEREALTGLESAARGSGPAALEAAHWLARTLLDQGRVEQAIEHLEKAIHRATNHPIRPYLELDLADARSHTSGPSPDILAIYAAVANDSTDAAVVARALYGAARTAQQLKKFEEAEQFARRFAADHSDHALLPEVNQILVESLAACGRRVEALRLLETMIAANPQHANTAVWYLRLAELRHVQGMHAEALEVYGLFLSRFADSPLIPQALLGQGWALLESGRHAEADRTFTKLVANHPDHALAIEARLGRAHCEEQAGHYAEALVDVEVYLNKWVPLAERDPANTQPVLDNVLPGRGHPQAAESDVAARLLKGRCQLAIEDYVAAEATFAEVVQDPDADRQEEDALYGLALSLGGQGKAAERNRHLTELVRQFPASRWAAQAHFLLAEAWFQAARYADAADAYRQVLEAHVDERLHEQAWYRLGCCRWQGGDFAAALEAFSKQLEEHPQGQLAHKALLLKAESAYRVGWFNTSVECFDQVAGHEATAPDTAALAGLRAAQCHAELGQWPDAERRLRDLLCAYPASRYAGHIRDELERTRRHQPPGG
jgi:TolA-binding protein